MFGIEKKGKPPKDITKTANDQKMQFSVHTMQDDIDAITRGETGATGTAQSGSQQGKSKEMLKTQQTQPATKNPFLTDTQEKQPAGKEQAKIPSDNPFFSSGSQTISTPLQQAEDISGKNIQNPKEQLSTSPAPTSVQNPTRAQTVPNVENIQQKMSSKIKIDDKPLKKKIAATSIENEVAKIAVHSGEKHDPTSDIPSQSIEAKDSPFVLPKQKTDIFGEQVTTSASTVDPNNSQPPTKSSGSKKIAFVISMIVLSTLIIAGGLFGWYWWTKNKTAPTVEEPLVTQEVTKNTDTQPETEIPAQEIQPAIKAYSQNLPNYIEISDSTTALTTFQQKLNEISTNVPLQDITTPLSFLVTDVSGNPLSFRAFALLTEMSLPEDVLVQTKDAFEIYAIPENGDVLFGLGVDVIGKEDLRAALLAYESELPRSVKLLYNSKQYEEGDALFADNIYGEYPIRYVNLTPDESLSLDYAIGDKLYIGTSKKSHREILERFGTLSDDITPQNSETLESPQQEGGIDDSPKNQDGEIFGKPEGGTF